MKTLRFLSVILILIALFFLSFPTFAVSPSLKLTSSSSANNIVVNLTLLPNNNPISGFSTTLVYNPALLKLVNSHLSPLFSTVITPLQEDNQGHLSFAIAISPNDSPVTTSSQIATFVFQPLQSHFQTTLNLQDTILTSLNSDKNLVSTIPSLVIKHSSLLSAPPSSSLSSSSSSPSNQSFFINLITFIKQIIVNLLSWK